MLEIRPNCEGCNKALPVASTEAYICSYECTFCKECVETLLENVCPNCGGGFCQRPIRPVNEYRPGVSTKSQPASNKAVSTPYDRDQIKAFIAPIKHLEPEKR